jgi:hypothetical protein
MRLNGWQRIGVIASAVWGIAGWLIGNSIGLHGGDLAESEFADCIASPITTGDACLAHFRTAYAAGIDGHWLTAAFWAVIPILLGWLAAWTIVALTRWVRRGFELEEIVYHGVELDPSRFVPPPESIETRYEDILPLH